MRILLVALHGGSSIPLFCFRPLFRQSCYHIDQCDRSPAGQSLSFCLCCGTSTNSWPLCDELALLIFLVKCFSFVHIVYSSARFLAHTPDIFFFCQIFHAHLLFTGLDDVLSRLEQLEQRPSRALPRLGDTSDTIGDESDMGESRRRLRSKKTYKMKKVWGASGVGQFFVTGPTDVATKPSHFHCRICRKDVFVLTHGHHEVLRHFQGSKHFPLDQRLRLETPGWEVLDYKGNAMSPAEVERQQERIMGAPLVVRDREYPFSEDVIVDETGAVDPNFGVMARVSSLIEVLRLGGSYEPVYQLWAQFTLSAVRVNVDVTWSRDDVWVSSYTLLRIFYVACVHPICWLF